jgi:hypothetical protein
VTSPTNLTCWIWWMKLNSTKSFGLSPRNILSLYDGTDSIKPYDLNPCNRTAEGLSTSARKLLWKRLREKLRRSSCLVPAKDRDHFLSCSFSTHEDKAGWVTLEDDRDACLVDCSATSKTIEDKARKLRCTSSLNPNKHSLRLSERTLLWLDLLFYLLLCLSFLYWVA